MEKIKCQCGHQNPPGTNLCASCGRPLTEKEKHQKLADMRYEGTARRSQTYNKSVVDKIWNFFSSVKVGIGIIIAILVAASIGTILPQQLFTPAYSQGADAVREYYADVYGTFGSIYHFLGFHDLYSSYWFQALIGMLGISLIIASLDRGVPLYKSLKKQRVLRHESFMKRQRLFGAGTSGSPDALRQAEKKLKDMRYNVRTDKNGLLAEKGRFSRWGPYVNHIGLIIFLIGVMFRMLPGFYVDEQMWIREGETRAIPGADGYYLASESFKVETYSGEGDEQVFEDALNEVGTVVKNYQTNSILYKVPEGSPPGSTENLEEVKEYPIQVNEPLKFDGYAVYQMDFRLNELKSMTFALTNKETEESRGELTVDLDNPQRVYELEDGSTVELLGYYPDFSGFAENGAPETATPIPNNPGFLVRMTTPETPEGETSFIVIRETIEPFGDNEYKLTFQSADTRNVSGLTVRKDETLPILILGGIIFMIGVTQGMYFNHRRIWIQEKPDGTLLVAAHTNKNWFALKKELDQMTETASLPGYTDQQEAGSPAKKEGEKQYDVS
ncbi:cytochrome c biogenesis protein ResB [Planococcus lenghuensis]|uniref:Cytochrome C biogenesis protein n=1 Tax=Planococcus lenghuensis TaxID=2213202 RepID=A0A1Q2KZN2_9BACL|nr:cytochrome c biogenesis protein ResB [Planococcus lenghuensis]AQQ53655.1 cytochrome C biogenesis protein [Planococcus lenghuensis]